MHTDEELQKLNSKVARLESELDRETTYTRKVNDKNMQLLEQIRELKHQFSNAIPKSEHERIIDNLRKVYEDKLSEIKPRIYNERGAGRKRIVSEETAAVVLEWSSQGLSQAKIAIKLSDEFSMKIGRTTVGEIVRGNYTPLDMP